MMKQEATHTDDPQAEEPPIELPEGEEAALADLKLTSLAIIGIARHKALDLATRPGAKDDGAEIRKLTALALSLGRIVEMEDRYAGKPAGAATGADMQREIKRLLDLRDDEIRRVLDAARKATEGEARPQLPPGLRPDDVGGAQS